MSPKVKINENVEVIEFDASQEIKLQAPKIGKAHVHIVGLSPLLCDRMDPDYLTGKKKPPKEPKLKFPLCHYSTLDGQYGFPAQGLKTSLVDASRRTGKKMIDMRGIIWVIADCPETNLIVLEAAPPAMQVDVVSPKPGQKNLATSAKFWPWEMTFKLEWSIGDLSESEMVGQIIAAGEYVGIGYRRVLSGDNRRLGRFRLESMTARLET